MAAAPPPDQRRFNKTVELNIGGVLYTSSRQTLTKYKDNVLTKLVEVQQAPDVDSKGRIFIDRDGELFQHVMNFLRDGSVPDNAELRRKLKVEAEFFRMKELTAALKKGGDSVWYGELFSLPQTKFDSKEDTLSDMFVPQMAVVRHGDQVVRRNCIICTLDLLKKLNLEAGKGQEKFSQFHYSPVVTLPEGHQLVHGSLTDTNSNWKVTKRLVRPEQSPKRCEKYLRIDPDNLKQKLEQITFIKSGHRVPLKLVVLNTAYTASNEWYTKIELEGESSCVNLVECVGVMPCVCQSMFAPGTVARSRVAELPPPHHNTEDKVEVVKSDWMLWDLRQRRHSCKCSAPFHLMVDIVETMMKNFGWATLAESTEDDKYKYSRKLWMSYV